MCTWPGCTTDHLVYSVSRAGSIPVSGGNRCHSAKYGILRSMANDLVRSEAKTVAVNGPGALVKAAKKAAKKHAKKAAKHASEIYYKNK